MIYGDAEEQDEQRQAMRLFPKGMWATFREWRAERRKRKSQARERDGYDWAAGALLRKEHTAMSITEQCWECIGCDRFDYGAMSAVIDFQFQLGNAKHL